VALAAAHQVVRREGVAALWKGNLATILHRLPYSSINFYTYEHANRFLLKQLPPKTDFARTLAAGGLAGLVSCSAVSPAAAAAAAAAAACSQATVKQM
jgi:solute carrier family 25 phosphate transporter 23/24/25/41